MTYFVYNYVAAHFVPIWRYSWANPRHPKTFTFQPPNVNFKFEGTFDGQAVWFSPAWARLHDLFVRYLWHPSRLLYSCTTLAVLAACIWMIRRMPWRPLAWTFMLLLLYFPLCNTFMAEIDYRYRIMLEP